MAESSERNDLSDFIKCAICLEIYKKPKCLPCLHSFCETCLQMYITSEVQNQAKNTDESKSKVDETPRESGFRCPTCRNFVDIDDELKNAWIQKLPDNFFIVSLIDKYSIQSESKTCDACIFNGKTELAVTWCSDCREALCQKCQSDHRKFKAFRNHSFLKLSVTTQQNVTSFSGFIPCPDHSSSPAQVFCADHKAACCTLCATIRHRKCSDILTLEDAANGVKDGKVTQDLRKRLDDLTENIKKKISNREDSQEKLKVSKECTEKEVTTVFNETIAHLETLRSSFMQELQTYEQSMSKTHDDEISKLSHLLSRVLLQRNLLDVSIAQGSNEECLVNIENIRRTESQIKDECDVFSYKASPGRISFTTNSEFRDIRSNLKSIGKFILMEKCLCMQTGQIKLLKKESSCIGNDICNAIFDFQNNIIITGVGSRRILVCDYSLNKKSSISVDGCPRDITKDKSGRIFVSLPQLRKVVEINLKTNTVQEMFHTTVDCWGICCMNNDFYITSGNIIQIYSSDGTKKEDMETSDTWMISGKENSGSIVYSKQNTVIERSVISKSEKKLHTLSGAGLRGIDTDYEGNIYTVGVYSKKLYQLSSDGTLLREVNLEDFDLRGKPLSVCLNDKNKFVITTNCGCVALFEITPVEQEA